MVKRNVDHRLLQQFPILNGREHKEIPVPGYGVKNYHLFLNIKK